jgi:hypothetical protein
MCLQETIGDCYMVAGGLIFTDAQGFKTVLQSKVRQKQPAGACTADVYTMRC